MGFYLVFRYNFYAVNEIRRVLDLRGCIRFGDHEKIVVVAVCPNVEQNRDDLRHSRFKDSCFDIAAAEL